MKLQLSDFLQTGAYALRFLGFHTRHLQEDTVRALSGDDWFGGPHAVEPLFDHGDRLIDLRGCDWHFISFCIHPRLDVQRERGASKDVDAALESILWWNHCGDAQSANAKGEYRAHVSSATLDFRGEIPEKHQHQS